MDRVKNVTICNKHRCNGCGKVLFPGDKCISRITHDYIAEYDYMSKSFSWYCSQNCYDAVEMLKLLTTEK